MQRDSSAFEKIAHRGASGEAPENTLPAFELAFRKYRLDRVEMDVRLTQDGVPVVFHDKTLERTTDGRGQLIENTFQELKTRDAGYWFDPEGLGEFPFRGKGIRIPTLEEVLTQFPNSGFFIELKDRQGKIVERALDVLNRMPNKSRIVIGSFGGRIARRLRRLCRNSFESFLTEDEVIRAYAAFRMGFRKIRLPARCASLPRSKYGVRLDRPAWIEFLHRQEAKVYYWTVNETWEMEELRRRGSDGILTDYPHLLPPLRNPHQM